MSAAVVFGATGFLGRGLLRDLLTGPDGDVLVVAAVRSAESGARLRDRLAADGVPLDRLSVHVFDPDAAELALDPAPADVRDVYNLAAAFAFGMTAHAAREVNVVLAAKITRFAAVAGARRLVHVSGYRVAAYPAVPAPWPGRHRRRTYRRFGAYEASKIEADAVVRALAAELGVPLTVVNPGTVIGDSRTGAADQYLGLAELVVQLARGQLRAVPGSRRTVLPVVTVDHLARFLALVPRDPETVGQAYWVLDEATPPLPELVALLADELGVPAPRRRIPVAVLRALPSRVTGAEKETLSFLSADTYPTASAAALARRHGLEYPPVRPALRLWARHLAATAPGSAGG
ncbi:MAG: SDR family oxidoreductase [Rhodococcus sp. (in: high G+C Gram-positive bacteria)]|nr:SDR family oxidoreductase [Rhodococcus sp. (in: high G+C Gram-positive bacteria)]MDX5451891.1 SDR family oxidoreductase [Rhodococcus sp. (in: high G+C Gram-positive bacteria)]